MDFKKKIKKKGLKIVWLAEQIECNYNSLRVYLKYPEQMPEEVREKLVKFLA